MSRLTTAMLALTLAFGIAIALSGLVVAPALAAPGGAADVATIRACVAGTDSPRDCIGTLATPCQDEEGGYTTIGIDACLRREQAAWDVILNETYRQAMADAKARDDDYAETSVEPTAAASLLDAQRAWIAFRDAECTRRYDLYKDGTIRTNIASDCLLELTAERAIDFMADL